MRRDCLFFLRKSLPPSLPGRREAQSIKCFRERLSFLFFFRPRSLFLKCFFVLLIWPFFLLPSPPMTPYFGAFFSGDSMWASLIIPRQVSFEAIRIRFHLLYVLPLCPGLLTMGPCLLSARSCSSILFCPRFFPFRTGPLFATNAPPFSWHP